jgi:hypothetical protein
MLVVSAIAALALLAPRANAAPTYGCTALPIAYGPVFNLTIPLQANPFFFPCADDDAVGGGGLTIPGVLSVTGTREGHTRALANGGTAQASWGALTLKVGGLPTIKVGALNSQASATCVGGNPVLNASSSVVGLKIGLLPALGLISGPLKIGLPNGSYVALNESQDFGVPGLLLRNALHVHTPNRDIYLGASEVAAFCDNLT